MSHKEKDIMERLLSNKMRREDFIKLYEWVTEDDEFQLELEEALKQKMDNGKL